VREHKLALQAQRLFWQTLLRDTIAFRDVQGALAVMEKTSHHAASMYQKIRERWVPADLGAVDVLP